ncbi:hypothetical protein SISSUDRAFT_1032840 [Sistotremastrum suecicum HHB10207 ss-3]|uniref:Uncharacterized protein n=1 Tax=Sistotremastrum suecicum HHB10207 ss-3 TaxID=1314776 RepID=A0A166E492_9AGAM|nr:hypothetical protein SISSUDRAFT_1032840 [Sistotremastrum suecicum HHB10207 ss-3]
MWAKAQPIGISAVHRFVEFPSTPWRKTDFRQDREGSYERDEQAYNRMPWFCCKTQYHNACAHAEVISLDQEDEVGLLLLPTSNQSHTNGGHDRRCSGGGQGAGPYCITGSSEMMHDIQPAVNQKFGAIMWMLVTPSNVCEEHSQILRSRPTGWVTGILRLKMR